MKEEKAKFEEKKGKRKETKDIRHGAVFTRKVVPFFLHQLRYKNYTYFRVSLNFLKLFFRLNFSLFFISFFSSSFFIFGFIFLVHHDIVFFFLFYTHYNETLCIYFSYTVIFIPFSFFESFRFCHTTVISFLPFFNS